MPVRVVQRSQEEAEYDAAKKKWMDDARSRVQQDRFSRGAQEDKGKEKREVGAFLVDGAPVKKLPPSPKKGGGGGLDGQGQTPRSPRLGRDARKRRRASILRLEEVGRRGRRFTQWGAVLRAGMSGYADYVGEHAAEFDSLDQIRRRQASRAGTEAAIAGGRKMAKKGLREADARIQGDWRKLKAERACKAARDESGTGS